MREQSKIESAPVSPHKLLEEVKSDLASEITYGDKREKSDEHIDYEQDLANRWNL